MIRTVPRSRSALVRGLTLSVLALALIATVTAMRGSDPAKAIAPCVPWTNSSDELAFLAQLQAWRDAQPGINSKPLVRSALLNQAAAGYAKFLAETGASGHYADGSNWNARAMNCGFTSNGSVAAGGEGLGYTFDASAALGQMTAHAGSGVYVPNGECVGVARVTVGSNTRWVVLIMRRLGSPCPEAVTGGPASPTATATPPTVATSTPTSTPVPPTNTPTSTSTPLPTSTPTMTPSPTSTATQTPPRFSMFIPGVCAGCED